MAHDICQIRQVEEADLVSLCTTCLSRAKCRDHLAVQLVHEAVDPSEYKIIIVTGCDEYLPREDMSPVRASLFQRMRTARVESACQSCPAEEQNACLTRDQLHRIRRNGHMRLNSLEFAVVTCKAQTGGLLRIGEPSKGEGR